MDKAVMTVREMAGVMRISMPTAYDLTNRADFPVIRLGKKKLIPTEAFKVWLENQTSQSGVGE